MQERLRRLIDGVIGPIEERAKTRRRIAQADVDRLEQISRILKNLESLASDGAAPDPLKDVPTDVLRKVARERSSRS